MKRYWGTVVALLAFCAVAQAQTITPAPGSPDPGAPVDVPSRQVQPPQEPPPPAGPPTEGSAPRASPGPAAPSVTPQAVGQVCHEALMTVVIGGQPQQAYQWMCRMPDGSWRPRN